MRTYTQPNDLSASALDDVQPLNHAILELALGDLEGDALDRRIEMSLATLFDAGGDLGDLVAESGGCEYFVCKGYWPEN